MAVVELGSRRDGRAGDDLVKARTHPLLGGAQFTPQCSEIVAAAGACQRGAQAFRRANLVELLRHRQPEQPLGVVHQDRRHVETLGHPGLEDPELTQATKPFARGAAEHLGERGGMAELQVLKNKFQIEQATVDVLDIPRTGGAVLPLDEISHIRHVAEKRGRITRSDQHIPNDVRNCRFERRRCGDYAGPRQRHVFPGPSGLPLVLSKCPELAGDGPGCARRA